MLLTVIYFILILGTIVLVHEAGHFIFAKIFGIYVHEFSIGMGPRVWKSKKKNAETIYSIRAIPIGGFVQLAGEGAEEDKKLSKDRLLQSKPVWQRFLVMFFGAGNNFILALITLFLIGLIWGAPSTSTIIPSVISSSPAEISGIRSGDKVIAIDGNRIKTLDDLQLYLTIASGETEITVLRDEQEVSFNITPLEGEERTEKGYSFGITFNQEIKHGIINSFKYSFTKFGAIVRQLVLTLKELFTGGVGVKDLSGPVGIYTIVDQTKTQGFENILYLLALLSINVGFLNLIPFPAFDGGRILFLIIEKIKGSPIKTETENLIHTIGFFLLIALILYVTFNDIIRLFH